MGGEEFAGGVPRPRPAGEDARGNSAAKPETPVITDPVVAAATERIADLDRAWFKRRPDRAHRIRRRIPGEPGLPDDPHELAPQDLLAFVALRRGVPSKVAIWGTKQPCSCENCAATLWETFAPGGPQPTAIAMRVPE